MRNALLRFGLLGLTAAVIPACGGGGGGGGVNGAPTATDDAYVTSYEVQLVLAALGVLANDTDPENDPLTAVPFAGASTQGGTVNLLADGSFTYDPPLGFHGIDTFPYSTSDGINNSAGMVTLTVGTLFVDNSAPGPGDGSAADPFTTLAAAQAASAPDDWITVLEGDSATPGSEYLGIALQARQQLIGQSGANDPVLSGNVALATGASVTGIDIDGAGLTAASITDATLDAVDVRNSPGNGIDLTAPQGTLTFTNTTVTGAAGSSLRIDGGDAAVSLAGTLTNTAGRVLEVLNTTGGSVLVNGTVTDSGGDGIRIEGNAGTVTVTNTAGAMLSTAGTSVTVVNNTGAVTFTNLELTAASGTGLFVVGSTSVTVNGAGNTAVATDGAAIDLTTSTVTATFLTATSTTSATDGIHLDTAAGALTVTGTTTLTTPAGHGILVQNSAAAVTFGATTITGAGLNGIRLDTNTGAFTLIGSGGISSPADPDESGVEATAVSDVTIRGNNSGDLFQVSGFGAGAAAVAHGIHVNGAANVDFRFLDINAISDAASFNTEHAVFLESVTTSIGVTDCSIASVSVGDGVKVATSDQAGTLTLNVSNNTVSGNGADFTSTDRAVDIVVNSASQGRVVATLNGNNVTSMRRGIFVELQGNLGTGGAGSNSVNLDGNTIIDLDDDGINLELQGSVNATYVVTNNTVDGSGALAGDPDRGIDFQYSGDNAAALARVTIQNNTVQDWIDQAIRLARFGGGELGELRVLIDGNAVTANGAEGLQFVVDNQMTVNATVQNNIMTLNGARQDYDFDAGVVPGVGGLNLNLLNNEDDQGFRIEAPFADGDFAVGGVLGQGFLFPDDNGNIANNGNTTGGGAPNILIGAGGGFQFQIINPATIPLP